MIIVKTPFRISFVGGGSDIDTFYKKHYGAVVSTTINKYMYIMIHPYFHKKIRIKYSKTEDVNSIDEIRHPLVRECLKLKRIRRGIEIASIADVPAGTGLGSSSAFTVGLLHSLSIYKTQMKAKKWLAEAACKIEIKKLNGPIGKQDQYAVSFGGLNFIRFNPDETVFVEPIILKPEVKKRLERNLLIFYVGNERKASQILKGQKEKMKEKEKYNIICKMVELAESLKQELIRNRLDNIGNLLHQGWILKMGLNGNITNPQLDYIYNKALKAGASGGKILGAGGGGFFLFYCEPECQNKLRQALGLHELNISFDSEGTKVVYLDKE